MGNRIRQLKFVRSCGYFIGIFWCSTGHFGSLHQKQPRHFSQTFVIGFDALCLSCGALITQCKWTLLFGSRWILRCLEQCREQERAARVHNLADLLWSCRSMLHNALSSLSTDPDHLVHEQKTNIRGGRSSTTSLCTCTSEQLYTPADQTPSCRFSVQIQTQSCSVDRH